MHCGEIKSFAFFMIGKAVWRAMNELHGFETSLYGLRITLKRRVDCLKSAGCSLAASNDRAQCGAVRSQAAQQWEMGSPHTRGVAEKALIGSLQLRTSKKGPVAHGTGPFDLVAGAGFEPATFRL